MYKINKEGFERYIDYLKDNFNFYGLYHFTDFSNLKDIFDSGFLKSRNQCEIEGVNFLDCANSEIIEQTIPLVKECVRFYFKEKTPMLYRTEGIKCGESPPHVPIPVYLVFSDELIYLEDTMFTDGNAKSDYSTIGSSYDFFKNMDWEKIFHRGSLPDDPYIKMEYVRKRHAELLSKSPVPITHLKKVIFRCDTDKKRAINLFGNKSEYLVNANFFNNHKNYIRDYSVEADLSKSMLRLSYSFNNSSYRNYGISYNVLNKFGRVLESKDLNFGEGAGLYWEFTLNNYKPTWHKIELYMGNFLCIEEFL